MFKHLCFKSIFLFLTLTNFCFSLLGETLEVNNENSSYQTCYTEESLSNIFSEISYTDLKLLNLNPALLVKTDDQLKLNIYNSIQRKDTIKYTLLNIIPGLGSMLQGDYVTGLYTLTSFTGVIASNSTNELETEYKVMVNLGGIFVYALSFIAPLKYNEKYNEEVFNKLSLKK